MVLNNFKPTEEFTFTKTLSNNLSPPIKMSRHARRLKHAVLAVMFWNLTGSIILSNNVESFYLVCAGTPLVISSRV